jgi:hypothetical protein
MSAVSLEMMVASTKPNSIGRQPVRNLVSTAFCGRCGDASADRWADYDLAGGYKFFRATAGQLDSSRETSQVVRMQVLLDGLVAFSKDVGFNESSSVDLDVSGATRMRLQVTLLDHQFSNLRAGFGEPILTRSSQSPIELKPGRAGLT